MRVAEQLENNFRREVYVLFRKEESDPREIYAETLRILKARIDNDALSWSISRSEGTIDQEPSFAVVADQRWYLSDDVVRTVQSVLTGVRQRAEKAGGELEWKTAEGFEEHSI